MSKLVIHDCSVIANPSPGEHVVREHCDVVLEGDRINTVRPTQLVSHNSKYEVIEAAGMLCMPGLINTHAHISMVLFRGLAEDVAIDSWFNDYIWPLERNLTEDDVYWGAQLALVEMIEAGVTTVADHYFHMDRVAEAVQQAGTRAVLGWAVFGDLGLDALQSTTEFVQRWQGKADGRITTLMAPHAPYTCDDDFLRATVAHAKHLNVGIHIHASERLSQTESSLAKRGLTPIGVLAETGILDVPTIIAHGCGIIQDDIELLKSVGQVGIAHAPKTYMKHANGLTPIKLLQAADIPVGLASDGAASNSTLDILEAMRLMAMSQKSEVIDPTWMSISNTLDIAFRGSARVLGMEDRIGKIAPGYLADVVLLDMRGAHHQPLHNVAASLVYNSQAGDVQTVIVNGEIIMRDREIETMDKAEIIFRVNASMERLSQRDPEKRIQVYNL